MAERHVASGLWPDGRGGDCNGVPDLIIVPARYGSSRLPGKPLLTIAGRTLLERVVANARAGAALAGGCQVLVATDDERIAAHAHALGVVAVMTAPDIDSGSARTFTAAMQIAKEAGENRPAAHIINLQGDAPFVSPAIIARLLDTLRRAEADVATPVYRLDWDRLDRLRAHKLTAPFSGTTCVRDTVGRALWFSKSILPAIRNEAGLRAAGPLSPVWQHIGLYGYHFEALAWFARAAPGVYEALEGLEQLRFLESGRTIATVEVEMPDHALSGVDTPADRKLAEDAIARLGDPFPEAMAIAEANATTDIGEVAGTLPG